MDDLRKYIQSVLSEGTLYTCGVVRADEMLENGSTYFGYTLEKNYNSSDFDNTYTSQINIIGRLSRLFNAGENTYQIVDQALDELSEKLKKMNIKYSIKDVTLDSKILKFSVNGYVILDEKNESFVR